MNSTHLNRKVDFATGPERTDSLLANQPITLTNAIVRGMYSMTVAEQRILRAAMAHVCNANKPRTYMEQVQNLTRTTRLTAAEFSNVFKVSSDVAYVTLAEISTKLLSRKVRYMAVRKSTMGKDVLVPTVSNWVSSVSYHKQEGWVEISWSPEIIDEIVFRMEEQFTRYRLNAVHSFKSSYTFRLFELLMAMRDKKASRVEGWLTLSVEDWCQMNDLPLTDKFGVPTNTALLERNTLKIPLQDLRSAGWTITIEKKKAGRRVIGWSFAYYHDGQSELILNDSRK